MLVGVRSTKNTSILSGSTHTHIHHRQFSCRHMTVNMTFGVRSSAVDDCITAIHFMTTRLKIPSVRCCALQQPIHPHAVCGIRGVSLVPPARAPALHVDHLWSLLHSSCLGVCIFPIGSITHIVGDEMNFPLLVTALGGVMLFGIATHREHKTGSGQGWDRLE